VPRGLLVALALCAPIAARAEAPDPPWSRGVTPAAKASAQKLLEQGNELFLANKYKEALAKYEAAVEIWDHPAIRFNMVRAQVALDRPLDAYDNLEKALAYGAGPLEDTVYQEAQNYQRLLAKQVSHLEVSCDQAGVVVALDGEALVTCPGTQRVRRTPGRHFLMGRGAALATLARDVVLIGGETETIALHLVRPAVATEPRWARWKPWTVVAGGAVLAGVGVGFNLRARSHRDELDRRSIESCANGCTEQQFTALGLADLESKVSRDNRISIAALVVGGAAILTGGALVVSNRRAIEISAEPGGARVSIAGRF